MSIADTRVRINKERKSKRHRCQRTLNQAHPNQAAGKKPHERTQNEANRHEQSEVPSPTEL